MNRTKKSSLRSLVKEMEIIAKGYFADQNEKSTDFLSDSGNLFFVNKKERFIHRVEDAYAKLDPLEQLIVNNDFFYEDYPGWWIDVFSKNSYLYLKRKAITHFLETFYEE